MAAFATSVYKKYRWHGGKTAPISPQNTIKKFKKREKIKQKNARPPASENLWECDANQVFFFGLINEAKHGLDSS